MATNRAAAWLVMASHEFSHSAVWGDPGVDIPGVVDGALWRFFTAGFVHFGVASLLFTVVVTYRYAASVAAVLGGVRPFLGMYVTVLVSGAAFVYAASWNVTGWYSPANGTPTAGLLGCAVVVLGLRGQSLRFAWVAIAVGAALVWWNVDVLAWPATVAGLVAGAAYGLVSVLPSRPRRVAIAVLWVFIVSAVVIRTITFPASVDNGIYNVQALSY